jgi:hypothetical protein
VTRQAVNKMVDSGKIPLHGKEGDKKRIDPAEADRALGANTQRILADDDDRGDRPAAPSQTSGLTSAKTATEVYRARLAQLEYNERVGKLRPIEQTEIGAQRCGEVMLRAIESMVGRAEELHARSTKEGVAGTRAALRLMVRDLRGVIAREFSKLASGELGAEALGEAEDDLS